MPCHEIELIQEFETTEPDADTISRTKAIDGKICIQRANGVEIYDDYAVPVKYLEQLPPAQPERIRGRWIYHPEWANDGECGYECSVCHMGSDIDYNFCMRCGADMREVTE